MNPSNNMTYLLQHAEFIALGLNLLMTIVFAIQRDYAKTLYWAGCCLVVLGVLTMRTK